MDEYIKERGIFMANANLQIAVKDADTARQWLEMVQLINQDYHVAMQEAAEVLNDVQNFADGTLIDDLVNFGTELLNVSQVVFEGIDEIATTVTTIIGAVGNFLEEAKSAVSNAVSQIFGR